MKNTRCHDNTPSIKETSEARLGVFGHGSDSGNVQNSIRFLTFLMYEYGFIVELEVLWAPISSALVKRTPLRLSLFNVTWNEEKVQNAMKVVS